MLATVTLIVTEGSLQGREFVFDSRTTCIVGRAPECNPQMPNDKAHSKISRYHCLLDINPPAIRVRDFGSKNGTFVNGQNIGQRAAHHSPEEGAKLQFRQYDLKEGDEIRLSDTVFRVRIDVTSEAETEEPMPVGISLSGSVPPEGEFPEIEGYRVLQLLGKGGFGEVYLAQQEETGETVALKLMRPEIVANPRAIRWFLREVENMKQLQHHNVVQLKECGYGEQLFFFTQEYCNAGSAMDLMERRGGKLSLSEAVPLTLQALEGLEYAHNVGLVHRDFKPANIFLSRVGQSYIAKVGDYGLAKAFDLAGLSGQTQTGTKAGTPVFMPRQQLLDFKYAKPAVDVWAAAASLYYFLTGAFPRDFTGQDQDPFLVVLTTSAIPIRDRDRSIPQSLAQLIDLGLQDNPEIYFQNAAAFQRALSQVWRSLS